MDTQYKFRWILRDDDGVIEKALIAFYEGIYFEESIRHPITDVFLRIDKRFNIIGKIKDDITYDQSHFGVISTDDELRVFLNIELAKDTIRVAIPEQRIN